MELGISLPIVIFDNRCYLCIQFAKMVNFFARGNLSLVGHYSENGEILRSQILDETALEMFWVVEKGCAYGGRAALIPLLKAIFSYKNKNQQKINLNPQCSIGCKNTKAVFVRSASLIRNSKKIIFDKKII